jgi:hypothetical protein
MVEHALRDRSIIHGWLHVRLVDIGWQDDTPGGIDDA